MKLARCAFLFAIVAVAAMLAFPGCASEEKKDNYAFQPPDQTGPGLTATGTGTVTGTGTATGTVTGTGTTGTGGAFAFDPSTTSVNPGATVSFTLSGGVGPYEIGFLSATDLQSYPSGQTPSGTYDQNTGLGEYVVGPTGDCTDRLYGQDSTGAQVFLTITINGGTVVDGQGNADETEVHDLVNTERAKAGVGPIAWDDGLWACAKAHSNDMCVREFFAHVNPDNEDPTDRARAGHAGSFTFNPIVPNPYTWGIGENIAYGYTSAAAVMIGWMNSSGHRANILNSSYTHIGVGQCDFCGTHWTQNFGTR